MSLETCRLCLSKDNLKPIFSKEMNSEKCSVDLSLITGLKIKLNDGLPQLICDSCTNVVNMALNFRKQCHSSEIELLRLGFEFKDTVKHANTVVKNEKHKQVEEKCSILEDSPKDYSDFEGFKIEVEIDRIENGSEIKTENAEAEFTQTPINKKPNNIGVKEKRAMYMELVDGVYDPNGPVKCKICKQSVSKWACFINHAKKHLGFKFICEFCGKSFISSTQLKRHCRSFHGLERELKCRHCSYLALDNTQLMVHERRAHTGERPYVCDVCRAAYFSRKCLLQHIESHRTVASVQCDQCLQLFKSARHVARHRYSAHGDKRRARRRERRELARDAIQH